MKTFMNWEKIGQIFGIARPARDRKDGEARVGLKVRKGLTHKLYKVARP